MITILVYNCIYKSMKCLPATSRISNLVTKYILTENKWA